MNSPIAYLNGQWVPATSLCVSVEDLGFLMGVTVVERLRTFQGKMFRQEDHIERLRRSLEIVGWQVDVIVAEVSVAIDEFMTRNEAQLIQGDDWFVVAYVTPGSKPNAQEPTVCVHGGPLLFSNWSASFRTGVKLVVVDTRQVPENCWPSEMKCRSRMHYYLADREATNKSPGARAILLDQDGFVGEASTANIVAHFPNRGLVTPLREKVLPGVTQQVLFEIADEIGIQHSEGDFTPEELVLADEVFLTSTSVCIQPVASIDNRPVGSGQPGPLYQRLLTAWGELTGVDIARQAEQFEVRHS